MDKALAGMVLICLVFLILIPLFMLSNYFFNDDVEEIDDLSEEALNKLEIKKLLLGTLLNWIHDNKLTNDQVSEQLKIRRKTTSNITYQRVDKFSIDRLIDLLHRAGKKVTISISD
jgi:predicted XRE-type DNA-binding protein